MIKKMMVRDIASNSTYEVVTIYFEEKEVVVKSSEYGYVNFTFDEIEFLDGQPKVSLIGELEKQLNDRKISFSGIGYTNCIVMHPITWDLLCATVGLFETDQIKLIKDVGHKLKYRGIKVIRSLDVKEYEFKIY